MGCITWGPGGYKNNLLGFIFIVHSSSANSGPTMYIEERFQIANHLVQLDMDGTQNQIAIALNQRRRACRRRRWWMRQTLYGQYERLMSELEVEDPAAFKNFVRVEPAMFRELGQQSARQVSSTGRHSTLVWGWTSCWGFCLQETAISPWCLASR